jgi:hypothetical protein
MELTKVLMHNRGHGAEPPRYASADVGEEASGSTIAPQSGFVRPAETKCVAVRAATTAIRAFESFVSVNTSFIETPTLRVLKSWSPDGRPPGAIECNFAGSRHSVLPVILLATSCQVSALAAGTPQQICRKLAKAFMALDKSITVILSVDDRHGFTVVDANVSARARGGQHDAARSGHRARHRRRFGRDRRVQVGSPCGLSFRGCEFEPDRRPLSSTVRSPSSRRQPMPMRDCG